MRISLGRRAFSFRNRIVFKEKSAKKNNNVPKAFETLEELIIESS